MSARRHLLPGLLGGFVLLLILTVFLAPYLWIVASFFKPQFFIFRDMSPIGWRTFVPTNPTLANFIHLFVAKGLGRALVNSAIVSACQVPERWRCAQPPLMA